jgi:riboflavin transporter FmnP
MEKQKLKINQSKLEVAVAIGFSLIIFVLSSTNLGYIEIGPHWNIDMGILPAIFAAMIGGYRVGIPVAIGWAVIAYINPSSNLQEYTIYGLLIERIVLVTIAYHAYKVCKKYYQYSPANVYRAIIAAVTAKNVASYIILAVVLDVDAWMLHATQQYLLELALSSLAMAFLIKHLRQVHILNGVKRREKAKALREASK